ncbi:MAG: hypothetical protein M0Z87_01565 [Actinomycetota bacterium]|nr:hypothetical protein [Actinomycetota bacterium]
MIVTTVLIALLVGLVEGTEALTVVLAVGLTRGWRASIGGTLAGLAVLAAVVVLLGGAALHAIPLQWLNLLLGTVLLLVGLRWLTKAILRVAGLVKMRDEEAAFAKTLAQLDSPAERSPVERSPAERSASARIGFATSFGAVLLEGAEVALAVVALGARPGTTLPAVVGAVAGVLAVVLAGIAVRKPLARVPENTIKLVVGVMLSAVGTVWAGEGLGMSWLAGQLTVVVLIAWYALLAWVAVRWARAGSVARKVETGRATTAGAAR